MTFDQWWILVVQVASFGLLAARSQLLSRWGYPVGLLAQPAYLYACAKAEQWGMLALTVYIIATLALGTYNRFWRTP